MARVKYIVVEIDGVEVLQPLERLLDDRDVVVTAPGYPQFLDGALAQITAQFAALAPGTADIDSILTSDTGEIMVDQNGYVLQRGFV
jgi:hypothetical protein